jgi:hypothetical protein
MPISRIKGAAHPRPTCHQGMQTDYFCFNSAWSGCFISISFNADDVTAQKLSPLFVTQCLCSSKIILQTYEKPRFPKGSSLVSSHYGRPADPLAQFCSCPLWHDQLTHHYPAAMSDNLKVDWGLHHRSQYRKVRISRLTTNMFGHWWFPIKNIVNHTDLFGTFPARPSKWQ